MSPYSAAHLLNVSSGARPARGMLPIRKCGLGPGGRSILTSLVAGRVAQSRKPNPAVQEPVTEFISQPGLEGARVFFPHGQTVSVKLSANQSEERKPWS